MAFLLSCLEGSIDLLKHYNPDIVNTIHALKSSIGKGLGVSGFAQAIGKVKSGLQGYEEGMTARTEGVKSELSSLSSTINRQKTEFNNMHNSKLVQQLSVVSTKASEYWNKVIGVELANSDLDESLGHKLLPAINLVKQAVKTLKDVSEDKAVTSQAGIVDTTLEAKKREIVALVGSHSDNVQKALKAEFIKVGDNISRLCHVRDENFALMKAAIEFTQQEVRVSIESFTDEYRKEITKSFDNLRIQMMSIDPLKDSGSTLKCLLEQDVLTIKSKVLEIGNQLSRHVSNLEARIGKADSFVDTALERVNEILREVEEDTGPNAKPIKDASKDITDHAETLHGRFEAMKGKYETIYKIIHGDNTGTESVLMKLKTLKKQISVPHSMDAFTGGGDWGVNHEIKELTSRISNNVKGYVSTLVEALEVGVNEAATSDPLGDGLGIKGIEALSRHVAEHLDELGMFGRRLNEALPAVVAKGPSSELATDLETFLYVFKDAKANWSTTKPPLSDMFRDLQEEFSTKAIAGVNDNQVKDLIVAAVNKGIERLQSALEIPVIKEMEKVHKISDMHKYFANSAVQNLKEKATVVSSSLNAMCAAVKKMAGQEAKGLQNVLNTLKNEAISKQRKHSESLGELQQQLSRFQKEQLSDQESGQIQNAIANVVKTINEDLEKLPGAVDNAQKEAEKLMTQLQDDINVIRNEINTINDKVNAAEKVLTSSIDALSRAYIHAENTSMRAVLSLRKTLIQMVNSAFSALTHQVQSLFAKQKQADLSALEGVVTAQLQEIERVIQADRGSGVKGYLGKMKESITDILDNPAPAPLVHSDTSILSVKLKSNFEPLLEYVIEQISSASPSAVSKVYTVEGLKSKLTTLLEKLAESKHFDDRFSSNLHSLNDALDTFKPPKYDNGKNPLLLDILRDSMRALSEQLGYAYINTYDGHPKMDLTKLVLTKTAPPPKVNESSKAGEQVLTPAGEKLSKVCLTALDILFHDLEELRQALRADDDWKTKKVCLIELSNGKKHMSALGLWLSNNGFVVSDNSNKQNGELDKRCDGKKLMQVLTGSKTHVFAGENNTTGALETLHYYLITYYKANHFRHIPSPKAPCSIYQMLEWLCGLYYNPMFGKLVDGFEALFDRKTHKLDVALPEEMNDVVQSPLKANHLTTTLRSVCFQSETVLVGILGHGHADGVYSTDFHINTDDLLYPTDFNTLVCLLFDILKCLQQQLYFLYEQCCHPTDVSGWSECWYGQGIAGSGWQCNDLQCHNQKCNQTADQKRDQIHNQSGDQHPECGLKSPLQSFLEDGLQGFLPHNVSARGPKMSCSSCSRAPPGTPCKTPMGFPAIGIAASHRKTGHHLSDVLVDFCGGAGSPLTKLCSLFNCILPSAPKTLGDMFSFYYYLLHDWDDANGNGNKHKKIAFDEQVSKAYFNDEYNLGDISLLFKYTKHAAFVHVPTNEVESLYHYSGNLCSIYNPADECYVTGRTCGAYMTPLSLEVYSTLTSKNAGGYLSWILYLTETFYNLLCQLYKRCEDSCAGRSRKCRVAGCVQGGCKVAAVDTLDTKKHGESCNSIVQCQNTLPTLFTYGFTYGDRISLNGNVDDKCVPKRRCKDFIEQLGRVCSDKSVLAKLIHETIPNFMWAIRSKFFWTTVALWLLSLLYLIHIMVIRLDLLHIKSHLHSPSSHRIAAQSLLAAARVNKLNRVFYLQP
ncbi:hypothetical protein, conserved [Babesia bigemina]|uniref:C3H1-type domain-containing protein n=1 Tax=Babesia bigemina TaxID=5866 RepID=A0A061BPE4_BABBI|nr:hypothetical protein, conserved [Babesia bigemina]CDR71385.1 hypothetical protein, conserved [Babesia bigemina]|eukprot:XP_012770335.1 hypothetical protein, conserved [Babesia bigemina]